jgi:hypothetical protein
MANFTTEADVRLKFQANDTNLIPTTLVGGSITDAHEEILRRLDPVFDVQPPEENVILGETMLAGAHLLHSLAASDALSQKTMTIGGQRIDAGQRFAALMTLADHAEREAWRIFEPYLQPRPAHAPATVTDTVHVLGE